MKKKYVIGSAAAAVLLAGAAGTYVMASGQDDTADGQYVMPPVQVALAPVEETGLNRTLAGVGELEAARQVLVAPETAGRITAIRFVSGDTVKEGQPLVQLNDAIEQGELAKLQAQLRNTEQLHNRTTQLFSKNMVAAAQVDNTRAERDMARGAIRQTQAQIAQKTIRAPFSGTLGIRQVHEGQYVQAGDPVVSLINADTLKINFSLDEQTVPQLYTGQPVTVLADAWPGETFSAKIVAVDPLIDKSRTVRVQAELPNHDGRLKAGMYAGVQVSQREASRVLTVPETAVTYSAYGDTVFVAQKSEDNRLIARRIAVKTGKRWDGKTEITEGLTAGMQVVTSGQLRLSDGSPIVQNDSDTLAAAQTTASRRK